jgi:hydrogenase maturation protease
VPERVLILGLGNDLLSDDGVGLIAARRVAELVPGADYREECSATVDLLPILSGYDRVVVIDAYLCPELPPCTTVRAPAEELPAGFGHRSFHVFPFREILRLGRELGMPMPERVMVHGMCVADPYTFGDALSPRVAGAWPAWAESIARAEFSAGGPRPS